MANKINGKGVSKVNNTFFLPSPSLRNSNGNQLTSYNKGGSFDADKNLNMILSPVTKNRILQNIETWRYAISEAELPIIPYRYSMQIMYMDTVLETHTRACLEFREHLTMSLKFNLVNGEDVNDEWTKYFEAPWFRTFLKNALGARGYGYTLLSMGDIVDKHFTNIVMIPRTHISPDRLVVASTPYSLTGAEFMKEPFIDTHIYIDTPDEHGLAACGYGYLYEVSKLAIVLKDNLSYNTDYNEIFGTPFRQLKSDRTDKENRKAMEKSLDDMGPLGWIITGKDDELVFHDAGAKAGWKAYGDLEKRLQGNISKIILGHADALDSTPGKMASGQGGEVSQQAIALGYVRQTDSEFVMDVVNDKLLPFMRRNGIMVPDNLVFKFTNDAEEQEAVISRNDENIKIAGYIADLVGSGYVVDNAWIEENMQIKLEEGRIVEETTGSVTNLMQTNDPRFKKFKENLDLKKKPKSLTDDEWEKYKVDLQYKKLTDGLTKEEYLEREAMLQHHRNHNTTPFGDGFEGDVLAHVNCKCSIIKGVWLFSGSPIPGPTVCQYCLDSAEDYMASRRGL